MRPSSPLLVATLLMPLALATAATVGADWMQWRGPEGTGCAADSDPPVEWSAAKNIKWKLAIPGHGHSSPIVLGDRVYLMTAIKTDRVVEPAGEDGAPAPESAARAPRGDERAGGGRRDRRGGGRGMRTPKPTSIYEFAVLAVDRKDGDVVWNRSVCEMVPHEGAHPTGTFASGSPITDGEHLYAFFGSRGLFCLDLEGNVKWTKDFGDMRTRNSFGEGASPALHDDTLVVPWDHEGQSFIAALDKRTGEERWRVERVERTTWTTPVIVEVGGTMQAVLAGTEATISYDLATGKEIWRCSGLTVNVIPTPVVGHGMIYLMSGYRGSALQAVKLAEASGDISDSEAVAWTHGRGTPYVPSPMLYGRNLYFLRSNNGVVSCFDAITGEPHYAGERLEGIANVYASPVGAGGRVYICGREGETIVLEDGPELKVLATNSLDEGIDASPAIVDDEIYVRGSSHLFCIAETGDSSSGE